MPTPYHWKQQALAITEAALGPDHPDIGLRLSNLATMLQDLGHARRRQAT